MGSGAEGYHGRSGARRRRSGEHIEQATGQASEGRRRIVREARITGVEVSCYFKGAKGPWKNVLQRPKASLECFEFIGTYSAILL